MRTISDLSLDINNCRGQGYDGAGNVSGKNQGLSARVLQINKKALYTHCFSHRLNLVVVKSCSIQVIENVFAQMKGFPGFSTCPNSVKEYSMNKLKYITQVKGAN